MPVWVREIADDECAAVGSLTLAAYRSLPGANASAAYEAELTDVVRRARDAVVLVAGIGEDDTPGAPVGAVTYVPDAANPYAELLRDGEAGIRMLAVDPASQRAGIGAALVEACIERASAAGRVRLCLHSTPNMAAAHRIYRRLGFRRAEDRDWRPVPDVELWGFVLDL